MDKKAFLAIALSMLVLLAWSSFLPKPQPVVNKEVIEKESVGQSVALTPKPPLVKEAKSILPGETTISVDLGVIGVDFNESSASIKSVVFKKYQGYKFILQQGLGLINSELRFKKIDSADPNSVIFIHTDKNKEIVKRFIFSKAKYSIDLQIEVRNLSSLPLQIDLPILLGYLDFSTDPINARYQDVTAFLFAKTLRPDPKKDSNIQGVNFAGVRDRYFCLIAQPEEKEMSLVVKKLSNQETEVYFQGADWTIQSGQKTFKKYAIFLGPQDVKLINAVNPSWSGIVNYGFFDLIAQALLQVLELLNRVVHNLGVAIILFSVLIYFLLYPLTLKQMRSMHQMQFLQPEIEKINKEYKDNPQKKNKEIMELYQKHKVNPFGGCLPLILQMPIFLALYQALTRSIALKGADFLWIKDLSDPDKLFVLDKALPFIGNQINLLPIFMVFGMFFQQKFSMASSGSGMASEQQKMMLFLIPIMMLFVFYHMPSGFVLYWLVNSCLSLAYQIKVNRGK